MLDVAHEERSIELDAALGKFFPAANQLEPEFRNGMSAKERKERKERVKE